MNMLISFWRLHNLLTKLYMHIVYFFLRVMHTVIMKDTS